MTYRVSPMVTHERLDCDVIAIHLETGIYYTFDGVAADCWQALAEGRTLDELAVALGDRFDMASSTLTIELSEFVTALADERLLMDVPDDPPTGSLDPASFKANVYAPPVVQRFDDLDDLLLLDPIHEVDDAGWPVARQD